MTFRSSFTRVSAAAFTVALLSVGAIATSAGAQADSPNDFTAALTADSVSVTVDLGATQYPAPPTGLYIEALRNGCTASATPCWSEEDADLQVTSDFTGQYVLSGLKPATEYQIGVLEYTGTSDLRFTGYVTTAPAVNAAPSEYPLATVSSDGIHVSVTPQAEYDPWNIHDGGTIAGLRYNVYAYVNGKRVEKVLSSVTAGTPHAVTGLPLNAKLTFTETDVNTVGESPESAASGWVTLAPKAPGAFAGRSYTGTTATEILWTKPSAGTGHITKFVVRLDRGSKKAFSRTYSAKTSDAEVRHLRRHTFYVVSITAYNDHGKHTTIRGVLTTK